MTPILKVSRPTRQPARGTFLWLLVFLALLTATLEPAIAGGVVTNCTDVDLRTALVGGGTVTFACDGVILLTNILTISQDTVMDGTAHSVSLSGNHSVRILSVGAGIQLTVKRLSIIHGSGGAILNAGTVRIVDCTLAGNDGFYAGAILNSGFLHVNGTSFLTNSGSVGATIFTGTSLDEPSLPISITNCTFFGNTSTLGGGSVVDTSERNLFGQTRPGPPIVLVHCTIISNSAPALVGATNSLNGSVFGNPVTVLNSIAAFNGTTSFRKVRDGGFNICSDTNSFLTNSTSRAGLNPMVGPLSDNGGTTLTVPLLSNSPALDTMTGPNCPDRDQRGVLRPVGAACDIGAYEGVPVPNNPNGVLQFALGTQRIRETDPTLQIDVRRASGVTGTVTVAYFTSNGTAEAGLDYEPTNGVLTFGPGQTNRSITIRLINDNAVETNELFFVRLANPTGGAELGDPVSTAITIQDDDITNRVNQCSDAALRDAIAQGGRIMFDCDGTITLTNSLDILTDITLDGSGHNVVISGGDQYRIFSVKPLINFLVRNLTLSQGVHRGAPNGGSGVGGAIYNDRGIVIVENCTLTQNSVVGAKGGTTSLGRPGGPGRGGAIYNSFGKLTLTNCTLIGNRATGGPGEDSTAPLAPGGSGGRGEGAAVYNDGGTVTFASSLVSSNGSAGGTPGRSSSGSSTGPSGAAAGGGFSQLSGTAELLSVRFENNACTSPISYLGGNTYGGAISQESGIITATNCVFSRNVVTGGSVLRYEAPGSGFGGAIFSQGSFEAALCTFEENRVNGGSGLNGSVSGFGGAIYNAGQIAINSSVLRANRAGGLGVGGGFYNSNYLVLCDSTISQNLASGDNGRYGGGFNPTIPGRDGRGGGLYNAGNLAATNNTWWQNTAQGGNYTYWAGTAPGGSATGGGIHNSGDLQLVHQTFSENHSQGGTGYPNGTGVGATIFSTNGTVRIRASVIANASAETNVFGNITDLGQNLCSSGTCNFDNSTSLNNLDPKLGPLDDYGGPTPTIPLLQGSAAINSADAPSAPPMDQRGIARPYGSAADIGAFESAPPYFVLGHVHVFGLPTNVWVSDGTKQWAPAIDGFYRISGIYPGIHTFTPTSAGRFFVPSNSVFSVEADVGGLDFSGYFFNSLILSKLTTNQFQLVFGAPQGPNSVGENFRLESSLDLTFWQPVSTNTVQANGLIELPIFNTQPREYFKIVKP